MRTVSRRMAVTGLLSLGCTACGGSAAGRAVEVAYQTLVKGTPDYPVTRERIARIPYASAYVRIGSGPRALLILARKSTDDLVWASADRSSLVTRGGRLVKTAGLAENLTDTSFLQPDPVAAGLHRLATDSEMVTRRSIDVDRAAFGQVIESHFVVVGPERLVLLDLPFETVQVREVNRRVQDGWEFENLFWADRQTGFVWRSLQHVSPKLGAIEFTVLKPPA